MGYEMLCWVASLRRRWKAALVHAVLISLLELGLFYYWFGIANRYAIFLYGHHGAGPFDSQTVSRYRMAGLVASGAVMIAYAVANWFAARIAGIFHRRYTPPEWWKVWILCVPPLAVTLPLIMTTLNRPVLPSAVAVTSMAFALCSLPLALIPGWLAAKDCQELAWLTLAGLGLVPSLLLLRVVELADKGQMAVGKAISIAIGGTLAGAVWSAAVVQLHSRRRGNHWRAESLMISALCLTYLLGPLMHYLLLTPPGFRYITVSDNFFAQNPVTQIACFFVAAVLAWVMVRFQRF